MGLLLQVNLSRYTFGSASLKYCLKGAYDTDLHVVNLRALGF